jgi:hypothetical protein
LISLIVEFTDELVVDAELSLAAKIFDTKKNRANAVKIIESIANDLDL